MLSCVNRRRIVAVIAVIVVAFIAHPMTARAHRLDLAVSSFYHNSPLPPHGELRVEITNPLDSIAGVTVRLKMSRTDIIRFRTAGFAAYQDSVGGTILGDWEYILARSTGGTGADLKITALAEGNLVPPINRGTGPSSTPRILFRVPYDILPATDTIAAAEVVVSIDIESPQLLGFSTPVGLTIPCFDSLMIPPALDTASIGIQVGGVFVEHCTCIADGDINGDGLGLSVGDMVNTLRTIYGMIDPPDSLCHVDLNADCVVDTVDLNLYLRYFDSGIIVFGPPPFPKPTCCYVTLKTCCQGITGNVDCDPEDRVDISDIAALIDNLYISLNMPCCFAEANVDGDPGRTVDIADLSALIDYLYISYTPPRPCF